jgi:hypothetical protein
MLLALLGMAGYVPQWNKHESQITYHSHSDSKPVETAENCCWVNIRNVDLSWEVWCGLVKQQYIVFFEPLGQTNEEWRMSKIYKMWGLLLIIMPGKRD